ncbi:MAG: MBL fold metallo-hydrolase [Pyrinomonadaceae bacterium]
MKLQSPKALRVSLAFILLLFTCTNFAFAQSTDEEPRIVPHRINEFLYVLYGGNGQGSNVGLLISDDGILLIDGMTEKSNEKLLGAIREISDKPIKYVLNTHSDFDHSGGNSFFSKMGATIISQENSLYSSAPTKLNFKNKLSLKFGVEEITAEHVVSHSFDDVIIRLTKSNVLFTGDVFTSNYFPSFLSLEGQDRALDLAIAQSDNSTVVVPGHGSVANRKDLVSFKENSSKWRARVGALVKQKTGIDSMVEDQQLKAIRDTFLINRPEGIPKERFKRFIERTLSSEFTQIVSLGKKQISDYVGDYELENKTILTVRMANNRLYLLKLNEFYAEILPLSAKRFKIRGALESEGHYLFGFDKKGKPNSLTFVDDGKSVMARKLSDVASRMH